METFKDRLLKELDDLNLKISKLYTFIESDKFKDINRFQQSILRIQHTAMHTYADCLIERISEIEQQNEN